MVDDFTNRQSGWPPDERYHSTLHPGTNVIRYVDGTYQVLVDIEETRMTVANNALIVRDVIIEVDITKVSGEDDRINGYGVECRWQYDRTSGYIFRLFGYGGWGVYRIENGVEHRLGGAAGVPHPAINPHDGTNRLRAECVGDRFKLAVNGTSIFETIDPTPFLESGQVTFVANRFGPLDLDIRYDNFIASAP